MRKIVLHTPKAIARDPDQKGIPLFTDSGTELAVPSEGLTMDDAKAWVATGAAAWVEASAAVRSEADA